MVYMSTALTSWLAAFEPFYSLPWFTSWTTLFVVLTIDLGLCTNGRLSKEKQIQHADVFVRPSYKKGLPSFCPFVPKKRKKKHKQYYLTNLLS